MSNPNKVIKQGQKGKMLCNIFTSSGTLYKNEIVKLDKDPISDGDLRVKDSTGRIWHIKSTDIQF